MNDEEKDAEYEEFKNFVDRFTFEKNREEVEHQKKIQHVLNGPLLDRWGARVKEETR